MKKFNFILLLAIVSIAVNAQEKEKIIPIVEFEGGYGGMDLQFWYINQKDDAPEIDTKGLYTDIKLGINYYGFTFLTKTQTYFVPNFMNNEKHETSKDWQNAPYFVIYDTELTYTYKKLKCVSFGFAHRCGHIIESSVVEKTARISMGHNKIFLRVKIK